MLPNKSLIKNICISVTHPILFRPVDTVSIIPWFMYICIMCSWFNICIYLHVTQACLKVPIAMFYFCQSQENFKYYQKCF